MAEAKKVIVCIPTFRRARSLARLLAALEEIEPGAAVRVLVADNDAENQDGFRLTQTLKGGYRWPLDAIIVPERGISQVRNALVIHALDKSDADFIAMLDDDE